MSEVLAERSVFASAPGKTILIGEHAAVYGYPAVAVPLPDLCVNVFLDAPGVNTPDSWENSFSFEVCGAEIFLEKTQNLAFLSCLDSASQLVFGKSLFSFVPQRIRVLANLPLGAGVGGSAALSVAVLRLFLAANASGFSHPPERLVEWANLLEKHFHGNPSGLDVAAVLAPGPIEFVKGIGAKRLRTGADFWLLLVDSGSRSLTIDMVSRVAALRAASPNAVNASLARLGDLTLDSVKALQNGRLDIVGSALTRAHSELAGLELSTPKLDNVVASMNKAGALGAKLTGAGGGGFALGIFADEPSICGDLLFDGLKAYKTRVVAQV